MNSKDRWSDFNYIIENEDLDVKEKGMLLILFRYVNHKTGYADPSRELLKKLTEIKKDETLDKIINSLIDKGFLIRESGRGIRSKYYINLEEKYVTNRRTSRGIKENVYININVNI